MGNSLSAQELTLSGVGPINHSLAGVAVALPRDSAGAIQWNPATISFLEQSEFQLGWGRHNAPWYGDEPIVYTALIGVWLVCELLSDDRILDDPYSRPRSDTDKKEPPPKQSALPALPIVRVPTFSYAYNKNRHWSFGLAVSEYGARKTGTVAIGDEIGIGEYRFQGYEFIPAFAYQESRRFSVGFAPIFSIDEMPNASLPIILSRYSNSNGYSQAQRSRAGVGMQAGVFYTPNQRARFGVSVRTPQWISGFTYRWTDPMTGEVGTKHLAFSQDSSFRIALGTSYTLRNDRTTIAADFRYDDYSHASALYDIPASFDPEVKKLGISRAVYSLALGMEHRPLDIVAFRVGYQWHHAVTPNKSVIYNTSLPVQSGHSIHYGLTCFFSELFDVSLSVSNAFGGGWESISTEDGTLRLRRNPNRSNFWLAARLRF
jgi:long-subunit fatty acid transport protein